MTLVVCLPGRGGRLRSACDQVLRLFEVALLYDMDSIQRVTMVEKDCLFCLKISFRMGARARVVTLGGLIRTRPVGARARVVILGGLICSRPVGARARFVTLGGSSCSRPMEDLFLLC